MNHIDYGFGRYILNFVSGLQFFSKLLFTFGQYFNDLFFCDVYIDMVEPLVVPNLDPGVYYIDVAEYFATEKKYEDQEEMINQVHFQTSNVGFTIIVDNSNSCFRRRKSKLVLGGERGGVNNRTKKKSKREDTISRK